MSSLFSRRKLVEIVLVERDVSLRNHLRSSLLREGYGSIKAHGEYDDVHESLASTLPDLVILDLGNFGARKVAKAVRDLRHFITGKNPFVPVIVTAWEASAAVVQEVAEAGIDDFIAKPIAPKQLLGRVQLLVKSRKNFVVTSNYIGPDRRRDPGRSSTISPIEVPNSLRDKELVDNWSSSAFISQVEQLKHFVNEEKSRRVAFQLSFLISLIISDFEGNCVSDQTVAQLNQLRQAITELTWRLTTTSLAPFLEMVEALDRLCQSTIANPKGTTPRDLQLMPLLGMAITKAAYPDRDENALIQDIADAIAGSRARRSQSTPSS